MLSKPSLLLHSYPLLIGICSTLKMKVVCSSEKYEFYLTGSHHNPENSDLYNYPCENLIYDTELKLFALFGRICHKSLKNLILALLNCKFLLIYGKISVFMGKYCFIEDRNGVDFYGCPLFDPFRYLDSDI
jgi:hypothetical protein